MAIIEIYKDTHFGAAELVWNVPHPDYDFSQHQKIIFTNVNIRIPLLTTRIVVHGQYDFDTAFYDYMILTTDDGRKVYYFINSIIAERNVIIFNVMLDVITTYDVLTKPISGVIIRKHDTNPNESKFDYPTALDFEGNYQDEVYSYVGYNPDAIRLIESTINLSEIDPSVNIPSPDGDDFVIPKLSKPLHVTEYEITAWGGNKIQDVNHAFTLYLNDLVDENILNTVRGLAGDGAISDSYTIPTEAVTIEADGAEVKKITGKILTKKTNLKLDINWSEMGWTPRNEAIKGMFRVAITSLQEKTRIIFPAWDLQESVDEDGYIIVNLWCDPKPSGAPYCCPDQVFSLHPNEREGIITLATLEVKSVRGGQWLRNPLIYSTARGEIFSAIETELQRQRAEYEKQVALHELEMSRREREIRIAQADYAYQSGLASSLIASGANLLSGDFGGAFTQAKAAFDATVNQTFIQQLRDLQAYEQEAERQLIQMAYRNNLRNLNIQESIRRVVPREVAFEVAESMGEYVGYNGFLISLQVPDLESLKAKDIEYSLYGYPVYEAVENFQMLENLRQNHTVYQFENPVVEVGGRIGDLVRAVLQAGIRILSRPYSRENLLDNPKLTTQNPQESHPVLTINEDLEVIS